MSASRFPSAAAPDDVDQQVISVASSADIVTARQHGRNMAAALGFAGSELTVIATVISELARNMIDYAGGGQIVLGHAHRDRQPGIMIVARDGGPGIADLGRALGSGYGATQGLGLGLAGVRRMMDEFEVCSQAGVGTTVTVRKWLG
jgi:serine/threonine-protein kinase RsbT